MPLRFSVAAHALSSYLQPADHFADASREEASSPSRGRWPGSQQGWNGSAEGHRLLRRRRSVERAASSNDWNNRPETQLLNEGRLRTQPDADLRLVALQSRARRKATRFKYWKDPLQVQSTCGHLHNGMQQRLYSTTLSPWRQNAVALSSEGDDQKN